MNTPKTNLIMRVSLHRYSFTDTNAPYVLDPEIQVDFSFVTDGCEWGDDLPATLIPVDAVEERSGQVLELLREVLDDSGIHDFDQHAQTLREKVRNFFLEASSALLDADDLEYSADFC